MRIKTYRKSSAFWKHGKHKGALVYSIQVNKQMAAKTKPVEMCESIAELMKGKGNAKKEKSGSGNRSRKSR